jgi:hypothetical protein
MTAQLPEKLLLDGEVLTLCGEPLADFLALNGAPPAFAINCTALWRGYIGTWEIRDARLFLIDIKGKYQDGTPASLERLFPSQLQRVFARWFTGTLRCPRGGQLEYIHMGYASVYEEDLLLHIEQGNLVGREIRVNGTAEHNARQGYRPAAFTTFPNGRKSGESNQ